MLVSMCVGGLFSSVVADVEDNNTFEKAEAITDQMQGQLLPGTLNLSLNDPVDYYKFNPPGGCRIMLNCTVLPGDKTSFTLFDFNKVILNNSSFMNPGQSWMKTYYIGQVVSTYYIKVDHDPAGGLGVSAYLMQVAWPDQGDGDSGGDAGDDINNPKDVNGLLHFNGTVGDSDSADFYSFHCNAGDEIHLTLGVNGGAGMGVMKFYGKDMVMLQRTLLVPAGSNAKIDAVAALGEGTYYFEVYSGEDHKGPGMQYYVNMSIVPLPPPDTEPPKVDITYPTEGATLDKTTVIMAGTASDNRALEKVEVAVNDGAWQTADGLEGWSQPMVLSVGQNVIMARATDKAGLNSTDEINVTVTGTGQTNDTVPPNLVITEPVDGAAQLGPLVEVRGTARDDRGLLRVELKAGTVGTWMVVAGLALWQMSVSLVNGSTLISVRAVDTSGNTATKQIMVYRLFPSDTDVVPPTVHFTDPATNVSAIRTMATTVKGVANDEHAVLKVDVSINGGPFVLAKSTALASAPAWSQWSFGVTLVLGENVLSARAMDTAGNIYHDIVIIIASNDTGDTTPPIIIVLSPVNGSVTNVTQLVVSGTATARSGIQRIDISQNDGPWVLATGNITWTYMALLINGPNVFKIRAIDKAANVNTTQVSITFNATADLAKPTLLIISPAYNTSFITDKIDVKGTVTDNLRVDRVDLTVNGIKMTVTGTTAWKSRITLKEGKNTIVVTAYDGGGNSDTKTLTVTYNKTSPKPPIPGFEVGFLLAAVLVGVALLGRKRRA
jgi:hypothetical protein